LLQGKRVLLIIAGGIAAYKSLELIRRLRDRGAAVRCVMTKAAAEFVTPLSVAALSENKVYSELFSLTDEAEMGHIRLSREADLLVVAPATADLMARMAAGMADDLAATTLIASDKPVLIAPAMNVMMWAHPATQANLATLAARGVRRVGPNSGYLADGEVGPGRMAEPLEIVAAIEKCLSDDQRLAGRRALVTSGPTREAIDPVRYLTNHSSGKQGHAIAAALAALGAETILVSGPTQEPTPTGVRLVAVESAREMLAARPKPRKSSRKTARPRRCCALPRTPTSCRPSRIAAMTGRRWWSALRPRPRMSSPTPSPSASARPATGSSPTMYRSAPRPLVAMRTRSTLSTRTGSRTGRS
jgi:phosphopantothenoylcysteine decarboxylase/phosphopantothenate--cysteine ligase